jgi:hypothetical protein
MLEDSDEESKKPSPSSSKSTSSFASKSIPKSTISSGLGSSSITSQSLAPLNGLGGLTKTTSSTFTPLSKQPSGSLTTAPKFGSLQNNKSVVQKKTKTRGRRRSL